MLPVEVESYLTHITGCRRSGRGSDMQGNLDNPDEMCGLQDVMREQR